MINQYLQADKINLAIDCCIFGFDGEDLKLLLIKRNFEPEMGKWSLMGGFLKKDEDLDNGAKRVLNELTGLSNVYLEQLQSFGSVGRDPLERTVSVCFYALINIHDHDVDLAKSKNGSWFSLNKRPDLIFDHNEMVEKSIKELRYKAALHPIGFELLPDKFTIPALQRLYEAIYGYKLDRRNFSRKILSTKLLMDTGEKDNNSTTKKASLFKLDTEKYTSQFNAFHYFINL
jgi:8-oxo-dGTP diphosphatase